MTTKTMYDVIDAHYKKEEQREAAKAIWKAGMSGKWLTIIFSIVGVSRGVLGLMYGDQEGIAYIVVVPIIALLFLYLPSMNMRQLKASVRLSAWLSMILGILTIPSLVGIWHLMRCVRALKRLGDYKPMKINRLSDEQMSALGKLDADEKQTVAILSALLVLSLLFMTGKVGEIYRNSTPEYNSSMITTVYDTERFSVKLSANASDEGDGRNDYGDGVTSNGIVYRDSLLDGKIGIMVGCSAVLVNGQPSSSIATREMVDSAFDDRKQELAKGSYTVNEVSRQYNDGEDGSVSGNLSITAKKDDEDLLIMVWYGLKGNEMCTLTVGAPSSLTQTVYSDVVNTFYLKW